MSVAKVGKSGGSGGVLNYVLKDEHARIIGGNVAGDKKEIKEQFAAFEDSRSSLKKNTTHITWSFAPGEQVSDEKAVQLAEALLKELKFEKTPYLIVRHSDKEKRETDPYQHIHIIAGRIRADRSVVPDFQIARRTIETVKELEKEHGLQQTPFIDRSQEKQPKREELKMIERTGELSARLVLQEQIKEVAADFPQTSEFVEELERRGVMVEFNIQKTGRIAGVSFETDGVAFKGSSLGKNYSWNGLQKQQGLSYERERDFGACQTASQRAGARRLERTTENREESFGSRVGFDQRAGSRSVDQSDDGVRGDHERERRTERQVGEARDGVSETRAGNGDAAIATEAQAVGRSERDVGAAIDRSADNQPNIERRADELRQGEQNLRQQSQEQRVAGSNTQEQTERSETQHSKLEGEDGRIRGRAGKLESGDWGHLEIHRSDFDRGLAGGAGVAGSDDVGRDRELVLSSEARAAGNSLRDSSSAMLTGDDRTTDQASAEQGRDEAQNGQKAAAVTQAINLAYGGSLPSDVQEQMTAQLARTEQLNDYYEQTRLTNWRETVEVSQQFVEATAQNLGAAVTSPPQTETERNERLNGWLQATVQVAVFEQTGRQLDKDVLQNLGERFAAGYEKMASEKEIGQLERLAERGGVAPPFVETQSEARAAMMMNAKSEEIAQPALAREREVVEQREQQAQALEQAKQDRQQIRERGGYGFSR